MFLCGGLSFLIFSTWLFFVFSGLSDLFKEKKYSLSRGKGLPFDYHRKYFNIVFYAIISFVLFVLLPAVFFLALIVDYFKYQM